MKIHEADAKSLLVAQGLPVPPWEVALTPTQARAAAVRFLADPANATGKVVIKAQVLVGGRGKAGGVKLAGSADEAEDVAAQILALEIKGLPGPASPGGAGRRDRQGVLPLGAPRPRDEAAHVHRAPRRAASRSSRSPPSDPEAIVYEHADPLLGLPDYAARELAFKIGFGPHWKAGAAIAKGLLRTMLANDADLVEINPLAVIREHGAQGVPVERLVCLDAKITLDDSALTRHPGHEALRDLDAEDPTDIEARRYDLTFIKLDGDIGCMVNGAGLAMTTMDLVKRAGGEPANFLDIGGGAKADRVAAAMRLILDDPNVKAILVNIFGGITRGDEVATRADRGARPAGARRADGRADRRHERRGGGASCCEAASFVTAAIARRGRGEGRCGRPAGDGVSILIGRDTRLVVQGITGREGEFHSRAMLEYGTNVVAGMTPGKGGQMALDGAVPVFNTVARGRRRDRRQHVVHLRPGGAAPPTPSSRPWRPGSRPSSASPRASRRSTWCRWSRRSGWRARR